MKEEKVKVNLRVGLLIRETLVDEAAVEDIRVGTLANRLLQSEMDKVMKVERADGCSGKAGTKAADTANDPKRCSSLLSVCYRRYAAESSALPCAGSIRK